MSLPIPSTSGAPLDPKQLQALDAPLIALTQQCGGDLRRLLFCFFSFLHRRTDFYLVPHPDDASSSMGFREGDAEKLLVAAFRQFPLRRIPKGGGANAAAPAKANKTPPPPAAAAASTTKEIAKKESEEKTTAPTAPAAAATSSSTPEESSSEAAGGTPSNEAASLTKAKATTDKDDKTTTKADKKEVATSSDPMSDVRYTEEGLQIPVGNGGSTKTYKWTQTIEECTVLIGVPKAFRGKDLDIKITNNTLSVKSKKPLEGETAPRTFVEGTLVEQVRSDESTWSVEGGVVIVTLDKKQQNFWKTVFQGDEEIDTELVDNRRHIGEYDDATQAKIRKIIFDQEQYHKGGPTSDEILGEKSAIPPLPPGVEYIDRKKLDEEEKKQKAAAAAAAKGS